MLVLAGVNQSAFAVGFESRCCAGANETGPLSN